MFSKKPPSIVFLATPDFAADILSHIIKNELATVKALWTKPDKPRGRGQNKAIKPNRLVQVAQDNNIPYYQVDKIKSDDVDLLRKLAVDLALVVAYGQILKPDFFTLPKWGTYNIHFSLLPKYRGASPIQTAILAGEEITGITLQQINQKMDEGDVVLQSSFDIRGLKAGQVFIKSSTVTLELMNEFFQNAPFYIEKKKLQNSSMATYCFKLEKHSGWIRDGDKIQTVNRKLLAFDTWPGIYISSGEDRFQLLAFGEQRPLMRSAGFLDKEGKKLWLTLSDGQIEITRLKRKGKKTLSSLDFLNGYKMNFPIKID